MTNDDNEKERRGSGKITRDDIESAFANLAGEGDEAAKRAVPGVVVVAGAIVLGAVTLAYLAGRRRGRRRSSLVIKRV
ncbi:MAG: hypothetical protein ACYDEP_07495 [Acidimicrobiales bacterium]